MAMSVQEAVGTQFVAGGSLVDEILAEVRVTPTDDGYELCRPGLQALISELVHPKRKGERVDHAVVAAMIGEIDRKLSQQMDEILHHPQFQALESAWRGLKLVVDRVDFRENIVVEFLSCSRDELYDDFEDASEVTRSGLYHHVYSAEYGNFGGRPYGAVIANYELGRDARDIDLLRRCASVAAVAHAPFIAAASPAFFGVESYLALDGKSDLQSHFESPHYTRYNAFRDTEDARYVGLVRPHVLLRLPHGQSTTPTKSFNYEEDVVGKHEAYLWGNASFVFATRLAESFAKYRWCVNIIGPQAGGSIDRLPLHQYEWMGATETKIPTEIALTERRELELSEQGLIGLCYRKHSDNACFFSASSVQRPKSYGQSAEGRAAEVNYRLGTQLPYMFLICRLAHYLKVLQREHIGSQKERIDLEQDLNQWIRQYVTEMDFIPEAIRGRRPLRMAKIVVQEVEGNAGWYKAEMQVRPAFKYMGSFFTLSLVGKLDKW